MKKGIILSLLLSVLLTSSAIAEVSIEDWQGVCSKVTEDTNIQVIASNNDCCCKDNGENGFICSPVPKGSCPNLKLSVGTTSDSDKPKAKTCPCFFARPSN